MLGDKIRQLRKLNHMSQEELAEKLDVSRQSISLWENNQTQPTIENIVVLSKLLGVSTDELLSANTLAAEGPESSCTTVTPVAISASEVNSKSNATASSAVIRDSNTTSQTRTKQKKTLLIAIPIFVLFLIIGGVAVRLFTNGFGGADSELSAEEIYNKISPSVVEIYAESATESSTGTGFFLDNQGTVVTNYHVIENCQTAKITLANGSSYQVTAVKGYDANRDIAILSTKCITSTPLSIRKTSVNTGEKVYAIGSSLGLTGSLSDGIISAVNREVEGNTYIQTTAPISQGNSGGPLVDAKGQVVGIVCASFTDGQNLNLAIPIAEVNKISLNNSIALDQLFPEAKREVEWISDWRFQYYADEDTYVLLFQLADKDEVPMSASGTVEIRIVNDDNVTVYSKIHNFTAANFEEWIYDDTDEMYLATIYISPQSITNGSTEYGTVYFEAYGDGYGFEECTVSVFDLPTSSNSTPSNPTQGGDTPNKPQQGGTSQDNPQQGGTTNKYTCLSLNCDNAVVKSGDYCSEHKCANNNCSFEKDCNSDYCGSCTCNTASCKKPHIENGYHCTEHTCKASGCTTEKQYSSDYCITHKCNSCNNQKIDNGSYCVDHTCAKNGCNWDKQYGSEYCFKHTCMAGTCKNETLGDGDYCEEHTCIVPGCDKQKLLDDYCYYHTP